MPRPRKCRKVCSLPDVWDFRPVRMGDVCVEDLPEPSGEDVVVLTVDELETIRLIDLEGHSQEECSDSMGVARTTVQAIYADARRKLAEMVAGGRPLSIRGGHYRVCGNHRHGHGGECRGCEKFKTCSVHSEGGKIMKIAMPLDETQKCVCVSFGRAPYFSFYDVETGTTEIMENPAASASGGAGLKAAQFVVDNGADALITVRCGENAGGVFSAAGIRVFKADGLDAGDNLTAFKDGKLVVLDHFHAGFHGRM